MPPTLARPKRAAESFARTNHRPSSSSAASSTATTSGQRQQPPVSSSSNKKPRFDLRNPSALAPDAADAADDYDDGTLDVDVIGTRGLQVRRNAVNIDGYDSDSEDEGRNGRAAEKVGGKVGRGKRTKDEEDEDEEGDMFADPDVEDDELQNGDTLDQAAAPTHAGQKRAVRFLDPDEIEGQILHSTSGGHVSATLHRHSQNPTNLSSHHSSSESETESDLDDSTRALPSSLGDADSAELGAGAKKTHAPKLDAFNMRAEQQEGRFDDQGNYVRKAADPDAVHDSWLEGVSKRDVRRAREAAEKREEGRRRRERERDALGSGEAVGRLIGLLEKGETVLEGLARLGKRKGGKGRNANNHRRKRKGRGEQRKTTEAMQDGDDEDAVVEEEEEEEKEETHRKAAIETITEAADLLLGRDQPDIYDAERELLVRQYRRETGEEWLDHDPPPSSRDGGDGSDDGNHDGASTDPMWEYRWSDGRDGGEIHGPYAGSLMAQWEGAGYFGEGVEFRRASEGDKGGWTRRVDFV